MSNFYFVYPLVATETRPTQPCKVPPEGTIPRCEHHVYYPQNFIDAKKPNYGCALCEHNSNNSDPDNFEMPRAGTHAQDRLRANEDGGDECPRCKSKFRYRLSAGKSKCADCGTAYKSKIKYTELVAA